jgi:hypothetical protein
VVVYTVAETVGVKTEGGNKEGKERDWGIKKGVLHLSLHYVWA